MSHDITHPINIIRGKLRKGDYTLRLWENLDPSSPEDNSAIFRKAAQAGTSLLELEKVKFTSILAGHAVNNPSPSAVKAVIAFPDGDVFFPSTSKSSRDYLL